MVKEPRDSEVLVVKYVVIHLQWKLLSVAVVIGPFLRQLIMGVYVSWRLVAPVMPVFCLINNAQEWSLARFLCNWLSNWLLSSWGNCSRQYGKTHRLLHLQLRHLMAGVCSAHDTLSYGLIQIVKPISRCFQPISNPPPFKCSKPKYVSSSQQVLVFGGGTINVKVTNHRCFYHNNIPPGFAPGLCARPVARGQSRGGNLGWYIRPGMPRRVMGKDGKRFVSKMAANDEWKNKWMTHQLTRLWL